MKINIVFVLSILILSGFIAVPAFAIDFYSPEPWATGITYEGYCDMYAEEVGHDTSWWRAKPSGGYMKVRSYWWSGSGFSYNDYDAPASAGPSTLFNWSGDYTHPGYPSTGVKFGTVYVYCCLNGTTNCAGKWPTGGNYTALNETRPPPSDEIDFIGYPLDGYSPLSVNFTVVNFTSINETGISWSFGDGQTELSSESFITHIYQNPGIYTVTMEAFNNSGFWNTVIKTNYVLASTPSGMVVNLDVKNGLTGALIQDATVGIQNTSTGVWRNTTAPTGLVYFTSTDPGYLYPLSQGQSITLAANKSGYKDAAETFAIPYNNYRARLFLMPDSIANETGAGTVVVNVIRNKDGLTVSGMSVVMDTGQVGLTNTAGATTLFNVTAGNRVVKVSDPDGGYMPTEKSFNLTAGETKLVVVEVVRVGETPVETPVSPTPTTRGTYDPDDPNSPVYGNYTTSEINEQGGAGVLGMLAQLIQLWPLAIVMLLMKALKSAMT